MHSGQHWAVIGGGILGMTVADELAQEGASVTLCEAASQLGGLTSDWTIGPIHWDRHYHVILLSDTALRSLLARLGLEEELRWTRTKTGFYANGQLHSISNALEFLSFPLLGLIDKARLAATIVYASRVRDWKSLEQVSVSEWLTQLSGQTTFEKVWRPLLLSKLGESYEQVSAAFIWTTINRLYAARRAKMKHEMFGYLPGGYARILNRYQEDLAAHGVAFRFNSSCRNVSSLGEGIEVTFSDGSSQRFDRVAMTIPSSIAAKVCPELSDAERKLLNGIRYQGIICASLVLSRPLGGYYLTYITDRSVPFTGVVEMSTLVDRTEFSGLHLVYLPKYVSPEDDYFNASDQEIRERFVPALRRMYPDLLESDILAFQVSRAKYVFPLPTLGYSGRLPPVRTSVRHLYILNSAHNVNGTANVNDTILVAQKNKATLL